MPVLLHFSDDCDDPLLFYSTIYNIAVVNIVLSKYLFVLNIIKKKRFGI